MQSVCLFAQGVNTLEQYMQAVMQHAWQQKMGAANRDAAAAGYRLFAANLRPQVMLQSFAPVFTRTSSSVVQPNGSITFQPLFQNNASLALSVQQVLPFTGGTLFAETTLDRFDDFGDKITLYNGIPLRLGYRQSLVGFNPVKWDKQIEEKQLQLSKAQYIADLADVQLAAVNFYFEALLAKANYAIADSNRMVNEKLQLIANERWQLGKISEDEKLQMEAEYQQSQMQLTEAKRIWQQAAYGMATMLPGLRQVSQALATPPVFALQLPGQEALVILAQRHTASIQAAQVQLQQQQRAAAQVKSTMGPTFEIASTIGLANSGGRLTEVYSRPFAEQQVRLGIAVPLVDWGRKRAATQQAAYRVAQAEAVVAQQKEATGIEINQLYVQLYELQDRLKAQYKLIDIWERRYRISTERYAAGVILLTELVLAQQNKDQAVRDYIMSLQQYYTGWYRLNGMVGGNLSFTIQDN